MSTSEAFLLQLASEEHIPLDRIQPIIERLNQEWYDTADSLKTLTAPEMERLNIPLRLANMIVARLNPVEAPSQLPAPHHLPNTADALASLVSVAVDDQTEGSLSDCITTLQLIVVNILQHPGEEKYTRVRLSNPNIAKKIGHFPDAVGFLEASGFQKDADTLVLRQHSTDTLNESLHELNTVAENLGFPAMEVQQLTFNPYQSNISSTNSDLPKITSSENNPELISKRIRQVQAERDVTFMQEEVKRQQVNRCPLVLQLTGTGNLQVALRKIEEMEGERQMRKFGPGFTVAGGRVGSFSEEEDPNLRAMKALIKASAMQENEENAKFHSKRKKELEALERHRSYGTVTIRVRFPDRFLLQGTFSVLETSQDVYSFVANNLQTADRPFYLYTAPPKEVLESSRKRNLKSLAPSCLLNFGWKDLSETGPNHGPFLVPALIAQAQQLDY